VSSLEHHLHVVARQVRHTDVSLGRPVDGVVSSVHSHCGHLLRLLRHHHTLLPVQPRAQHSRHRTTHVTPEQVPADGVEQKLISI
jgi:hypothetical protein